MKESLLHLLWKLKRFDHNDLHTVSGEKIKIIKYGTHNHDAGPDFLNAEIVIGNTKWVGHVEMHLRSKDWNTHKHQDDPAYNSVILHVVYEHNGIANNHNGQEIPILELNNRIDHSLIQKHQKLEESQAWIPCADAITPSHIDTQRFFLDRVLTERMEEKCARIKTLLKASNNDWEDVLYTMILRYFGLKINGDAFEQLARITPHKLIHKNHSNIHKLESLLLGQSGLILDGNDDYIISLSKEYNHLRNKYKLTPMTGVEWKFARLRPANFPTIRLAQVAQLYHKTPRLFDVLINAENISVIKNILNVETSAYWQSHYLPDKESDKKVKKLGQQAQDTIIINAIIPTIFSYGMITDDMRYKEKAINLLLDLPQEKNNIISGWKSLGFSIKTAFESQALLQLKSKYCDKIRCLDCGLGQKILFS